MSTEKIFICERCNNEFTSTANHAKFCKDCARIRRNERAREYSANLKANNVRHIGDRAVCPECGNEYIINSGSQKVCDSCRKKYTNKMRAKSNDNYKSKVYDTVSFYVKKGEKDSLKNLIEGYNEATGNDMSLNEFLNKAVLLQREILEAEINAKTGNLNHTEN